MNKLIAKFIPRSKAGSIIISVVVTALAAMAATGFSVNVLLDYGLGLFILVPLFIGVIAPVIYGYHEHRTFKQCMGVALLALATLGLCLLVFAIEGIVCMVMAFPIAGLFTLIGAAMGFAIQDAGNQKNLPKTLLIFLVVTPSFMALESATHEEPTVYPVSTQVEINAPIDSVWKNVVQFQRLNPPTEFMFQHGISYPIEAEINGSGVGAVRYCHFSTGSFVEPITAWDEPNLLQFSVEEQPIPMQEMSPYNIDPAHLHNYFVSKKGQFELTELENGNTLLVGTTWYYNKIYPERYWKLWTDLIIHTIHERVLTHIKQCSEA